MLCWVFPGRGGRGSSVVRWAGFHCGGLLFTGSLALGEAAGVVVSLGPVEAPRHMGLPAEELINGVPCLAGDCWAMIYPEALGWCF